MRRFKFAKLVRDKIVEDIIAKGGKPEWNILSTPEYVAELKKKLSEEAEELANANKEELINELADVQEIIDNLLLALNVSKEKLKEAQEFKNKKAGSFKKRHYIEHVEVKEDAEVINFYLKHPGKYPELP